MSQIKPVFQASDGTIFNTKKEALDHERLPKITDALNNLTDNNEDLVKWLIENQEAVEMAFETGTIRRVTKSDKNKLEKACAALVEVGKDDPKLAFIVDNIEAVKESFRWPSVPRMSPEQKAAEAKSTLVELSEGNEKLADWVLANKEAVLEAYAAGVEKRVVSPKATEALAAYRAKMAAAKAAKEKAAS